VSSVLGRFDPPFLDVNKFYFLPFRSFAQRPKSAYFFFMDDVRARIKKENPDKSIGELAKVMGLEWNKIKEDSPKEFEKYNKKAAEDKARYEKAMEAYKK